MPPQQQNPYDFIMNPQQPQRGPRFGNSMAARIIIVVGGIILGIIIIAVIASILSGGDKDQTKRLTEIAQAQSEIIRVSALGKENAKDTKAQALAINTNVSVLSSQQEVKKLLNTRGVKEKAISKELAASKNSKNDQALDEAKKNNRYDETLITILNKQLTDYQTLLKSAYDSGTKKERDTLTKAFESAGKLVVKEATSL